MRVIRWTIFPQSATTSAAEIPAGLRGISTSSVRSGSSPRRIGPPARPASHPRTRFEPVGQFRTQLLSAFLPLSRIAAHPFTAPTWSFILLHGDVRCWRFMGDVRGDGELLPPMRCLTSRIYKSPWAQAPATNQQKTRQSGGFLRFPTMVKAEQIRPGPLSKKTSTLSSPEQVPQCQEAALSTCLKVAGKVFPCTSGKPGVVLLHACADPRRNKGPCASVAESLI